MGASRELLARAYLALADAGLRWGVDAVFAGVVAYPTWAPRRVRVWRRRNTSTAFAPASTRGFERWAARRTHAPPMVRRPGTFHA